MWKMTSDGHSLHPYEELMLLALRDDKGTLESKASMYQYALGGAILTELAMNEVIRIRSDKKMLVDHVSSRHIGDPILDECLELVSSAKRRRRARDWVERFGAFTFAVALGYERASRAQQAALALAFGGTLVLLEADRFHLSGKYLVGDLLVFINATSFALFLVLSRKAVDRHGAMGLTALVMGASAVAVAPLALWSGVAHGAAWGALPQQVLLAAAYTIILATVVTYSLNYYALGKVPSSKVALFIYLQPLIATSTSIAVGRDVLSPRLLLSAALILGGIALTAISYRDDAEESGPS